MAAVQDAPPHSVSHDTTAATDHSGPSRTANMAHYVERGEEMTDSDRDDGSDPDFGPPPAGLARTATRASSRHAAPLAADPEARTRAPGAGMTAPAGSLAATGFRDHDVRRKRFGGLVWELENKGAVARDHLALERTFLAWLRTSLALASIGIAVTQLFRLPTSTSTSTAAVNQIAEPSSFLISSLASSSYPSIANLVPVIEAQQAQLATLQRQAASRYSHLAKPIGGTFIALALLFLLLGTFRFFHVQHAFVSEPSVFPPSRKTYAVGAFCIGALIIATFSAILANPTV
ncbi:hypothetical protein BMF94_6072 [Rhodotorula taiwanensis]|uniref:DUF202 domain-containing protein n=1 Tax=Rhodotorula taiwanensis TaxID=741276 RepID=A0A2S5B290_9BASI|nr:hypothetical protein BMF94_6072 [Rhodotorula taiwanensis]